VRLSNLGMRRRSEVTHCRVAKYETYLNWGEGQLSWCEFSKAEVGHSQVSTPKVLKILLIFRMSHMLEKLSYGPGTIVTSTFFRLQGIVR
jgi:hypothetical protein